MSSGRNILFPRHAVSAEICGRVKLARVARGWSQESLARKVGVDRRTIIRLERGTHRPTSHLVHALEETLSLVGLVPGWKDPAFPDAPSFGPRARLARLARGLTQVDAARAAGVSAATLSRFEREMGDAADLVGEDGMINDRYAASLGFYDAAEMNDYCMSLDAAPWLRRLKVDLSSERSTK